MSAQPRLRRFASRLGTFVENMVAMSAARDFSSTLDLKASAKAFGSIEKALDMLVANWSMTVPICVLIAPESCVIIWVIAVVIASCMTAPMAAPTPCVRVAPSCVAICVEMAFMTWVEMSVPIFARAGSSPMALIRLALSLSASTTWSEVTAVRIFSRTSGWVK